MKNFLAFTYVFLVLLGIVLLFLAAITARKRQISKAKKMFFSALCSIAAAMLLLFVTGVIVSN